MEREYHVVILGYSYDPRPVRIYRIDQVLLCKESQLDGVMRAMSHTYWGPNAPIVGRQYEIKVIQKEPESPFAKEATVVG